VFWFSDYERCFLILRESLGGLTEGMGGDWKMCLALN